MKTRKLELLDDAGARHAIEVALTDEAARVGELELGVIARRDGELVVAGPEGRRRVFFARDGEHFHVVVDGRSFRFRRAGLEAGRGGAEADENEAELVAPMVGRVVKVSAEAGQEVDEGHVVVVVEAMKMEHQLRAPFAGRVAALDCAEGDQVDMGQVLARVERRATEGEG